MHPGRLLAALVVVLAAGALLVAALASGDEDQRSAPPPRPVVAVTPATRPHLLVDGHDIASSTGIERVITPPAKRPEPIVDAVQDHNSQSYTTILRERGVYRLWYSAKVGELRLALGYATSRDGIHFRRPFRLLPVPRDYQYGTTIVPDGRGGYVMPYYAKNLADGHDEFKGLNVALSPDGLRWRSLYPTPRFQIADLGISRVPSDILSIRRHRGRYLLYVKMNGVGYEGMTPHMPFPGYRRIVGVMHSRDGRTWTPPRKIITPDARDEGITEFYGLGGVIQRGGLLVGFLRVLRDDLPANEGGPVQGLGYTVLAWSRDGVRWQRDRQPFVDRGAPGSWDRAMAWADAQIVAGDRTLVYYGGYLTGHKGDPQKERQIGVATMGADRYVAREAKARGRLVTRPVTLRRGLTVNASGAVRVTVRRAGRVLASCAAAGDDGTARAVPCARGLRGRVQLDFGLDRARLFAFSV